MIESAKFNNSYLDCSLQYNFSAIFEWFLFTIYECFSSNMSYVIYSNCSSCNDCLIIMNGVCFCQLDFCPWNSCTSHWFITCLHTHLLMIVPFFPIQNNTGCSQEPELINIYSDIEREKLLPNVQQTKITAALPEFESGWKWK